MKREGGTTRLGVILTAALGLIAGLLVTVTTPVGSAVAAQPVSDDFADGDYDGGTNWDGDWDEFGDGTDSPTTGTIQVVSQQLRFQGIGSDFIQRDVDLSDFAGAELSVDLVSESGNEDLELQLDDGTSFVRLGDIGDGDAVGTKTFNIPASLQIDTTLRIVGEDTNWGSNEQVTIDNILISQEGRPPTNAQNNPEIELGAQANHTATALHAATAAIQGIELPDPPAVNSLYPILPSSAIEPLREWSFFWPWDPARHQVRWMTAWDTTSTDVERFTNGVTEVLARCN